MVDLEKLKNDLREVAQAAGHGHLTRAELLNLKLDVAWVQVAIRESLVRHLHPEEVATRNQRGYS